MPQLTIVTEADRDSAIKLMGMVLLPFTLEWHKGRDRSLDQNRLQWKWATEVATQLGDRDAADVQADWKLRHGVPILREDSEDFRRVYDRHLKPLAFEDKIAAMRYLDIGVTRIMKVAQMTRYLDSIQRECATMGLQLTEPEG